MSFPPATEMFQFAGFASAPYGFRYGYPLPGGLPHSETPGSTIARISPGLFAACHVLHRLSVPRHPPDALPLRLSTAPNGKDHPDIRTQISDVRTLRRQTLLLRRHFAREHAHGLSAARGFPPRSHNSLLYDCPSTNPQPSLTRSRRQSLLPAASQHRFRSLSP